MVRGPDSRKRRGRQLAEIPPLIHGAPRSGIGYSLANFAPIDVMRRFHAAVAPSWRRSTDIDGEIVLSNLA
jgi:hypothetical protein